MKALIKSSTGTFEIEYDENGNFLLKDFSHEKIEEIKHILDDDVTISVDSKIYYSGVNIELLYVEFYEDETIAYLRFEEVRPDPFKEQMEAKMDYISLMTGIELEEDAPTLMSLSSNGGKISRSPKYTTLLRYFKNGVWGEQKMRAAVEKHWITMLEFEQITGISY